MASVSAIVVDTNVIGYGLLRTQPFSAEVETLGRRDTRWYAPVHWQSELANLIWFSTRSGVITPTEAREKLLLAEKMEIASVSILQIWTGAFERSLRTGLAIYDTLFVELAVQMDCPLVTFDKALVRVYPQIACRPGDLA